MDLFKSTGALLRNLRKVFLNGSKALQADQKRDYHNEGKFMHASTRSYSVTCVCTVCNKPSAEVRTCHAAT